MCVCSGLLLRGCRSKISPMCTSLGTTFWSECHLRNFTCRHPKANFTITRYRQCSQTCQSQNASTNVATDTCGAPKKSGPCKAYITRFYFDQDTNKCNSFVWGGCDANGNNYLSKRECQEECAGIQLLHLLYISIILLFHQRFFIHRFPRVSFWREFRIWCV